MILLNNQQDKASRDFTNKHRKEFEKVINYPKCLKDFPNISKFPAVGVEIPEYVKDNSLWYLVKKTPNYKRLGMLTSEFQKLNHAMKASCGTASGADLMDKYIEDKGIKDTDKKFWVELCNDLIIPSHMVGWGVNYVVDLGEECSVEIDEINKTRTISYNPNDPLFETITTHIEIIYPDTYDDVIKMIDKVKRIEERTKVRNDIYTRI